MDGGLRIAPAGWFAPGQAVLLARAPGRLDVLGGIADYSGATVLELPLALQAMVAVADEPGGMLHACTGGPAVAALAAARVAVPAAVILDGPAAQAPERLRQALIARDAGWAAYVLGPLAMLRAAGLLPAIAGLRLALWSEVPIGAGLSSSAALEIASLRAFQAHLDLTLDPLAAAAMAQQAENRVALAPCGIMDQATSLLGRRDHLLMLRCQPASVLGQRTLPAGVRVLGIDSGVAHRVAGHQYGRVRAAAFMGRAIIAAHNPQDPPGGYLCNLTPPHFQAGYEALLPLELSGAEFLARYGGTGDEATRVDPAVLYRVRDCTAHPVFEQENVYQFLAAMDRHEERGNATALESAGEAMLRSHRSYGERCGLGTPETDLLVELLTGQGPRRGVYGAKITGGGGGGTVAILCAGQGVDAIVQEVADAYARRTGHRARVIAGSGEGALAQPVSRLHADAEGGLSYGH